MRRAATPFETPPAPLPPFGFVELFPLAAPALSPPCKKPSVPVPRRPALPPLVSPALVAEPYLPEVQPARFHPKQPIATYQLRVIRMANQGQSRRVPTRDAIARIEPSGSRQWLELPLSGGISGRAITLSRRESP
jgi:hypothetical protein